MDPEIKKALDELREQLGKNAEGLARLDAIETAATAREASVTAIRTELDAVKAAHEEREKALTDMQQKLRVQREAADPAQERQRAVEMFGMQMRQLFCEHRRLELPTRFRGERDRVSEYLKQRATVEESTGAGTYFIPTILEADIVDTLEEVSDVLGRVDFAMGMPTKGTIPTLTTRPSLQPKRASSDTAMTQTDFGFSQMTWDTEECYLFFPVDNWVLELSPFGLGQRLIPLTREAFLDGLAKWVMLADGTSSYNSDTGIFNEATYVTAMASGHKAFGDLSNGDLIKLMAATLKRGRARGTWTMSLHVLGVMEEMNRTGKVPIITYGQGDEIYCKRRPVVIEESAPDEGDDAADTAMLGFGDLGAWFVVLAGSGIQMATSTEYLFGKNQTCYRATAHIDVVRKPVNTFRLLKTAAA